MHSNFYCDPNALAQAKLIVMFSGCFLSVPFLGTLDLNPKGWRWRVPVGIALIAAPIVYAFMVKC